MNFSEVFIRRPVATTLITLGIVLSGLAALRLLPVAPLPQVEFPTISVSASLPGASPEIMAATVATPLERALGRIAGVTEMTSNSSLGQTRVVLQFDLDRSIESAANDVQAAINAARGSLPSGLVRNPTYRKVNPADTPVFMIALTSGSMTRGQMYDVAATVLAQKLAQVRGVGQVTIGGSSLPAVRVQVNPLQLDRYGIGLEQVRLAIAGANANRPKGSVADETRHWQVGANDQSRDVADYVPLVVSYRNGAAVRLSDVASVRESVEDERNAGSANGRPSVLLVVYRQPGANIIETVDRIYDLMPGLRALAPAAIDMQVVLDRTPTIRASLHEIERTLVISVALVVMVVFLFLRSAAATLVPAVAVPASLVGTFGVMYLAGYSLDNLSLMALTIATGFVVDDAIVVLENIARRRETGEPPLAAAIAGAREVGFTVVAISLSLIAVFIPILAMGGVVGRLFREFAVVLSVAILISLLVSLTTTPMLCARLLGRQRGGAPGDIASAGGTGSDETIAAEGRLARFGRRALERVVDGYARSVGWALDHGWLMLGLLAATIALNVWLYAIVPKGFFPAQDTGRLFMSIRGDQSISFQAMQKKLADFIEIIRADPAVTIVTGFTGGSRVNSGWGFVTLKPLGERKESAEQVVTRLRTATSRVPGARVFMVPVREIRIGGRQSSSEFQYTLLTDDLEVLRTWEPRIRDALSRLPQVTDIDTDQEDKGRQVSLTIDRDAAARLGIPTRRITSLLNDAYGQRQVSTIYQPLNQYHVVLEVGAEFRDSPDDLRNFSVPNAAGVAVPLSQFARWAPTPVPLGVSHQGQFAASTISFSLPEGVSLSQASAAIEETVARLGVPTSLYGSFAGTAGAFQRSLESQPLLILAALVTVYLVLGILYESLVHPITILSTLPSAGVGALLALMATDTEFSIIALIGVLLLIGIVKKNAIIMIDFAIAAERELGLAPREAIHRACRLRVRPILMTTMAAMLGAVPLALGTGNGAELRQPLGITIVGGLALSQLLTLYTTPVVYLYLDRLAARLRRGARTPPGGAALHGTSLRSAWLPGVALLCVLLAGCATPPAYERPHIAVPPAYRETLPEGRQAARPAALHDGAWWRAFGDSRLDALIADLDTGNQDLQRAAAVLRQARAATDAARAGLYPSVSASASASRSHQAGTDFSSFGLGVAAGWEVDLWSRVRSGVSAAEAAASASEADLAAARLSLRAQLAQSYLQLRIAEAQRKLLGETVDSYRRSLELTRNRLAAGVATRADVAQAQTQLKNAEAQRLEVGIARAQLEHAVALLTGRAPVALALAEAPTPAEVPSVPVGVPSQLLERRPDVSAAERRVAAANAQIGVARAAWFPSLTLSADGGLRSNQLGELLSLPNRFWSLGPSLAAALFDGGARAAASEQAEAAHDATVAAYRQTVLAALGEVEDSLVALSVLADQEQVQREALAAARTALEITTLQYKAGTVSFLNVIVAQTAALQAERALLDLRGRRLTATVALIKATGGGW